MKKPVKKGVCLCDPILRRDPDGTAGAHLLYQRLTTLMTQWNLLGALLKNTNSFLSSNEYTAEKHCTLLLGCE